MTDDRQAVIVTDLTFGDAGKGSIVDFLTREFSAHTVVRFNGGAQAAHNVITPDGRHHTFAQFGSGTLVPGTRTYLSRFMMVNPFSMFPEAEHLRELGIGNPFELVTIDEGALITTPYQVASNRLREIVRNEGRHGSCGMGIGETMSDYLTHGPAVIFARDLFDRRTLAQKLRFLRELKLSEIEPLLPGISLDDQALAELSILRNESMDEICMDAFGDLAELVRIVSGEYLARILEEGTVVFEGAQGVLLDEAYGFPPYTTWSTTTFRNALTLLGEIGYDGDLTKLGLFRGYVTRHGPGPFPTEDAELTSLVPDWHNGNNPWQREFRVGYFDLPLAHYAMDIAGKPDVLAITNLDRMSDMPSWQVCSSYELSDGSEISRITPAESKDLVYQESLTEMLFGCKPTYEQLDLGNLPGYLAYLEDKLGIPIGITSAGPTANDKTTFWQNQIGEKPLAA